MPYFFCPSPIGILTLTQQDDSIIRLDFPGVSMQGAPEPTPLLLEACRQLREYFPDSAAPSSSHWRPKARPFSSRCGRHWQKSPMAKPAPTAKSLRLSAEKTPAGQ